MTRGGTRKGAGRKPGSTKTESRTEQMHYRVSPAERVLIEEAAQFLGVAPARFAADAVVEAAQKLKSGT